MSLSVGLRFDWSVSEECAIDTGSRTHRDVQCHWVYGAAFGSSSASRAYTDTVGRSAPIAAAHGVRVEIERSQICSKEYGQCTRGEQPMLRLWKSRRP
jgi:hypothetical protein